MKNFYIPLINDGSFKKLSFSEEDMERLLNELYYLRKSLMVKHNVEIKSYVLSPKDYLLFKNGTKYLKKYSTPQYTEFKGMMFYGVPILCGIDKTTTATISEYDAIRMIEL